MPQKPKRPCRWGVPDFANRAKYSVRIISCGVVIDSAEVLQNRDMTGNGEKPALCF